MRFKALDPSDGKFWANPEAFWLKEIAYQLALMNELKQTAITDHKYQQADAFTSFCFICQRHQMMHKDV